MTKRKLVLSSAIAALVSASFAANSISAFADEPAANVEHPVAKHGKKTNKKCKHCKKKDCKDKECGKKGSCEGKTDKNGCEGKKAKGSCESKDGCHESSEAPKSEAPKPVEAEKPAEAK